MIICLGTTPARQRTMVFSSLALDAVNRARSVVETASGKVINVARVLHSLDAPCIATGFLGGESGAFMRRDMDSSGIAHDFVDARAETRTCITLIDERAGTATELVEEARPIETTLWEALARKLDALLSHAMILVLSGTVAPGAPDDFYTDCVRRANAAAVKTIVDASGAPLSHALSARPFMVKPNRAELARTLGIAIDSDDALRSAMRQILDGGAQRIVVTLGKDGAVAFDGQHFWRVASPTVKAINPIGSGDSFAAGLAAALHRGDEFPDALVLATACGIANALTRVAGHVRAEDVQHFTGVVRVESWER